MDSLGSIALHQVRPEGFAVGSPGLGLPVEQPISIRAVVRPTLGTADNSSEGMAVHPSGDPAQPHDPASAAREFEALLIGQMLRSAHESGDQDDPTSNTMWDMAAQQFSRVLANNGGLGLAKIITKGLHANQSRK